MGLDMNLYGYTKGVPENKRGGKYGWGEDLAYWRKHPDLHGYIVENFADGVDNCQDIPLTAAQLRQTADACNARALPHTEGSFFGQSSWTYDEDPRDEKSAELLRKAAEWLEADDSRAVSYQASW